MDRLRPEQIYFRVFPKVVLANELTEIAIEPLYDYYQIKDDEIYEVCIVPMEHRNPNENLLIPSAFQVDSVFDSVETKEIKPCDGKFIFQHLFFEEQEHIIYLRETSENKRLVGAFNVYSLRHDLFHRLPLKGDLHMHSNRSDGREPPAFVAASCRKIGLDFMALTDHGKYEPSIEAQRAFDFDKIDLKIFRGEEVHAPNNPVHIVNFGGNFSVNDLFRGDNYQNYLNEVEDISANLGCLKQGVDRYQYASCLWVFQKIRQARGLGIFCHPYWLITSGYSPSGPLTDYLFETQPFDALEVIGGYYKNQVDSNTLQVARYHEERAKGKKIPVVGVSDAHGCESGDLFGWYYTIVFSPTNELQDIIQSIKDGYSVAVENMRGESKRAYGPFRMVKFALFALRELYYEHDRFCEEEGQLMLEHLKNNEEAEDILESKKGRAIDSLKRLYGR